MNNLFDKIFSIDEFRLSALIFSMFALIASCLVSYFIYGHIPEGLITLSQTLIGCVSGINAVNIIGNAISNKKSSQPYQSSYEEDNLGSYKPDSSIPPKI